MSQINCKSQKEHTATNENTEEYLESRFKPNEALDYQF